jgi:DNA-directed RNA polymerase specialized sigma24 family protein
VKLEWSQELEDYTRRSVRAWCGRLGVRGEEVKDLEQDAVIDGILKTRAGKLKYKTILWRIARNTVVESKSRRKSVLAVESEFPIEGELSHCSSIHSRLIVDELSVKYPELMMLAHARSEGFEWREISEALGVNCQTIRGRYSRMRKQCLREYGVNAVDILRGLKQ